MVVAEHSHRGYVEEAARAFMAWATAERSITRFRACISPHDTPFLNLIRKLGFVRAGTKHQQRRGEELIFHPATRQNRPRVHHDLEHARNDLRHNR